MCHLLCNDDDADDDNDDDTDESSLLCPCSPIRLLL